MGSFDDQILENKNEFNSRLISSVFKYQRTSDIKNLPDFKDAIINELGNKMDKGGSSSFISEQAWIKLFNDWKTKEIITENVGEEKARDLYGEVRRGQVEVHRTDGKPTEIAVTIIKSPIISSKGYINKKGKSIKPYKRTKSIRFTNEQVKFLRLLKPRLKAKKISTNQIITKFNVRYKDNPRTSSSIKTKVFRI